MHREARSGAGDARDLLPIWEEAHTVEAHLLQGDAGPVDALLVRRRTLGAAWITAEEPDAEAGEAREEVSSHDHGKGSSRGVHRVLRDHASVPRRAVLRDPRLRPVVH